MTITVKYINLWMFDLIHLSKTQVNIVELIQPQLHFKIINLLFYEDFIDCQRTIS